MARTFNVPEALNGLLWDIERFVERGDSHEGTLRFVVRKLRHLKKDLEMIDKYNIRRDYYGNRRTKKDAEQHTE